ncbi:aryl-alcohol dehydrogenase-like predicted oxidoreductase [Peribacillus deserti]|uniref:Aryl-alcohol dehydrogenase-like predicted oxidoreductase n=1 Tax=Peribacillus deserti TaxID=673318 RepID=A0ABS2QLY9_9BACI|nr:aldo/keto reductase [Peribacillus deserti]MBM7694194.1 aryl-alcohol dehydrogenase-like predicted oxidoreductase [Peribacillus deserti]
MEKAIQLETVSKELGSTHSQQAISWGLGNKNVSNALAGASSLEQIEEETTNFLELPDTIMTKIDRILDIKITFM